MTIYNHSIIKQIQELLIIVKNSVKIFFSFFFSFAFLKTHRYLRVTLSNLNKIIDSDRTYQYKKAQ